MKPPKTLQEAIIFFSDPVNVQQFMIAMRWPDGKAVCPRCGSENIAYLEKARIYKCYNKHPKEKFSLKVGTIFEDSPLGLDKWLAAMWMIANCKNGISSYEIHRALGITQKSAWFMLHRIRLAMQTGSIEKFSGEIECDETYVGGDGKNMHRSKRKRFGTHGMHKGTADHKTAVFGMIRRGDEVRAKVVDKIRKEKLLPIILENVEPSSNIFTDQARLYMDLHRQYVHETVNHTIEYVRGNVHTNSIENFWSLLKRTIKGTYVSVAPEHLQKYVEEQTFRFNERKGNDLTRFMGVIKAISGKRLTYSQLIGLQSERF